MIQGRRFGRLHLPDKRDAKYPFRLATTTRRTTRTKRYWNPSQWWGDQGPNPHCVGYAWTHWLEDGPITHRDVPAPVVDPRVLYYAAQRCDKWPGEDYDGTSVRAGAKCLQRWGLVGEYQWARNVDDVIAAVLEVGPVVVGTWWTMDMSRPDARTSRMSIDGPYIGGHAYVINGLNLTTGLFRVKNSWGREWGRNGHAYLRVIDFAELLRTDGECCIATEYSTDEKTNILIPN